MSSGEFIEKSKRIFIVLVSPLLSLSLPLTATSGTGLIPSSIDEKLNLKLMIINSYQRKELSIYRENVRCTVTKIRPTYTEYTLSIVTT